MFTGIISELGILVQISLSRGGKIFEIHAPPICKKLKVGDSVALAGACHTVVARTNTTFAVESIPETLRRTNLGDLKVNSRVNLERPLTADGRLDGHFVTGHVDDTARVTKITTHKNSVLFEFTLPHALTKFVVEKGSIALDGVSFTVIKIVDSQLTIGIIPHTLAVTTFGVRKIGDRVNVETDLLAKHLAKLQYGRVC